MTLLSKELWDKMKEEGAELTPWQGTPFVGVDGTPLQIHGTSLLKVWLGKNEFEVHCLIADIHTAEGILGRDFLGPNQCIVDAGNKTLRLGSGEIIPLQQPLQNLNPPTQAVGVVMSETVRVPAFSEVEIMATARDASNSETWLMEPLPQEKIRTPILVARSVVHPESDTVPVRLLNLSADAVTIYKGKKIAEMETIEGANIEETNTETVSAVSSSGCIKATTELEEELQKLVDGSEEKLSETEKTQLLSLLLEYHSLFAASTSDLGRTNRIQHHIDTGSNPPVRQGVRRISPALRGEVRELLDEMSKKDVIQKSTSPWASPIVLVRKKDGRLRFCVDYRKVNSITRRDAYPLPRVDDTLTTLDGTKWFSTLDMISGYWQVEVAPEDREKTAFCTHEGLYEFKVMPFGLTNAPATFQRLMDSVLAGLQWKSCLVYLDDIIICGKTFEEHLSNLRAVFECLKQAGLKLQPTKCAFARKKVEFLGHIVSEDGIATDPAKVEKVANWPEPTSMKEVQQFLGLASYYRQFIKDFSMYAKPLCKLTEKGAEFRWTADCQNAFLDLRRKLVSAPILAFPNFSKPFLLDTDASDNGIGAVLSQVQEDGRECVIAYASRMLTKAERRYCVTRKELLAVVTFVHHFRHYLLGQQFTLRTDHGSLTWLKNFKHPEGQLARWLERLEEYNFTVVHRPGRKHCNADALSRLPCRQCGREPDPTGENDVRIVTTPSQSDQTSLGGRTNSEIRQLQLQDATIGPLLLAKEADQRPSQHTASSQSPAYRKLVQLWDQLIVTNGLLWRMFEDAEGGSSHPQLVVPRALRDNILQELHSGAAGGHLGSEKVLSQLKKRYYWPGHWNDVKNWCATCPECATRKTAAPQRKAPLQTIMAGFPMQTVAVDIMGPLPESPSGNLYVLVAGDYFTRYMEVYPIPNQEAVTVAKKLIDELFLRFSTPEQLHSDQGRQFESDLIAEICKVLHIEKSRTTLYHPQGDGLVERYNRTLLNMLSTTVKDHPHNWEDHIRKVCMAYNTCVHPTTGFTPFYLMFGRQARLPVDIVYGTSIPDETSTNEYAATLRSSLEEAYDKVRSHMGKKIERQQELYNKKVHGEPFECNDLVWLHSKVVPRGQSRKLHHPWKGPFRVLKRISDVTYRIQNEQCKRQRLVVHFDRLKPCNTKVRLEKQAKRQHSKPVTTDQRKPIGSELEQVDFEDTEVIIPPADSSSQPQQQRTPPRVETRPPRYPTRTRRPPERFDVTS